mgnify:CR=1 FL=1
MWSPKEARRMVLGIKGELIHQLELSEREFHTARSRRAMTARQRLAVIAHEILIDSMSDVDIAQLLGMARTTYVHLWTAYKQGRVHSY